MATSNFTRAMLVAALVAAGAVATSHAQGEAPNAPAIQLTGSDAGSRFIPLGVGKSVVIDLPRDVRDVLVTDPTIANAVVRTTRRAYVIGVKVGQTNIFFFDAAGRQIAGLDIAVNRDLNGVRAMLRRRRRRPTSRSTASARASCCRARSAPRRNRSRRSRWRRGWSASPARWSTT